jgi:hypothetical protein
MTAGGSGASTLNAALSLVKRLGVKFRAGCASATIVNGVGRVSFEVVERDSNHASAEAI